MAAIECIRSETPADLARLVAERWLAQVPADRETFVALSGGRISSAFFQAAAARAGNVLHRTHFFWADERCVPADDPESNYATAKRCLFEPLGIGQDYIHRIRGEAPPDHAALEAEAELCRLAPMNSEGCPVLDIAFLGMGEDGHIASLFPGEPLEVQAGKAVYRPVVAAKPPPNRITIGYSTLAAAKAAWVLVSGSGKEQTLKQSIDGTGHTPLAQLLKQRSKTLLFTNV